MQLPVLENVPVSGLLTQRAGPGRGCCSQGEAEEAAGPGRKAVRFLWLGFSHCQCDALGRSLCSSILLLCIQSSGAFKFPSCRVLTIPDSPWFPWVPITLRL